jgi:hypothetical protein
LAFNENIFKLLLIVVMGIITMKMNNEKTNLNLNPNTLQKPKQNFYYDKT